MVSPKKCVQHIWGEWWDYFIVPCGKCGVPYPAKVTAVPYPAKVTAVPYPAKVAAVPYPAKPQEQCYPFLLVCAVCPNSGMAASVWDFSLVHRC